MALEYARKVNQLCLHSQKLTEQAAAADGASAAALTQGGYLQLELAMRFYVLELAANATVEFVTPDTISRAYEQAPSVDLAELVDLVKRPESWLARFLRQLLVLRSGENHGKLKGSIFQLDDNEGDNLISAQDLSYQAQHANLEDLQLALSDFKHLVARQREVRAEY